MGQPQLAAALRRHPVAAASSALYITGFGIYGALGGSPSLIQYVAVMVVGLTAVAYLDARVRFSQFVITGLALWGLLHMCGGIIQLGSGQVLYSYRLIPGYLRFDNLVHAVGFGVGTVACWEALRPRLAPDVSMTRGLASLIALSGMGVGALNEVVEFLATRVSPATNVGGYSNTGWDLVFNSIGCTVAALTIFKRQSAPTR